MQVIKLKHKTYWHFISKHANITSSQYLCI